MAETELKWWNDDSGPLIESLYSKGYDSREVTALLIGAAASVLAAQRQHETDKETVHVAENFAGTMVFLTKDLLKEKRQKHS